MKRNHTYCLSKQQLDFIPVAGRFELMLKPEGYNYY